MAIEYNLSVFDILLEKKFALYSVVALDKAAEALHMNQLSKVKNALRGFLLAPFCILEERECNKKLQERITRLKEKEQWYKKNLH